MRQFGYTKVRFLGLKNKAVQFDTPFALGNPRMARRKLLAGAARARSKTPTSRIVLWEGHSEGDGSASGSAVSA